MNDTKPAQVKSPANRRFVIAMALVLVALFVLVLFSMKTGSLEITYGDLFRGLFLEYDRDVAVVYDLRFPRIVISLIAGAALAVSGVLLQAVMQNPLTDPGIIGISSAASLAGTLVAMVFPSLYFSIPAISVAGGLLAYFLIYTLAWEGGV